MAQTPPVAGAGGGPGLLIDTKDGSFCGIKLGDYGLDTLSKLPYTSQQDLRDAQEAFKQSMKSRTFFRTAVPGVTDVNLGFNRIDGTLYEIRCDSRDLKTVQGPGVGSTVAEFTKAFGNPVQVIPMQPGTALMYRAGVLIIYAFVTDDGPPETAVYRMWIMRSGK
jgi:hypothetical protein